MPDYGLNEIQSKKWYCTDYWRAEETNQPWHRRWQQCRTGRQNVNNQPFYFGNSGMLIMPHPYGRMANRLILATHFIAQAEEYGDTFLHLAFADYFHFFEGTKHVPFIYYRSTQPQVYRKQKLLRCVNIWNTNDKRNEPYFLNQEAFLSEEKGTHYLFVIGWSFRAPELVDKHRLLIRKIFTPVAKHREAVSRLIESVRTGTDHLVGIHIRQTDYKTFANGKYFYPLSLYRRVMDDMASQLKGSVRFLICSDAPVDRKAFIGLDLVSATGHPIEDNYALAACDYIVGPPSTYTGWASFYGGVPRHFIRSPEEKIDIHSFEIPSSV